MLLRTLGMFAEIATIAAFSTQAEELAGDFVDQLLNENTDSPADVPPR